MKTAYFVINYDTTADKVAYLVAVIYYKHGRHGHHALVADHCALVTAHYALVTDHSFNVMHHAANCCYGVGIADSSG